MTERVRCNQRLYLTCSSSLVLRHNDVLTPNENKEKVPSSSEKSDRQKLQISHIPFLSLRTCDLIRMHQAQR